MQKIIFLDCDGVLNRQPTKSELELCRTEKWSKELENEVVGLNPKLVSILKTIIDATNAVIVASTSWRYFTDHPTVGADWRQTLSNMLKKDKSIFIGDTPNLTMCGGWDSGTSSRCRGNEIKFWLENNTEPGKFKYVVLDDDIEDIITVIPKKNVFKTNPITGLTIEIANKVTDCLNS